MLRSLMTAASGMKAQQMQVDTIANNIANVNTGGFKKSNLAFRLVTFDSMNFYEAFRSKFNFKIRTDAVPSRGQAASPGT